MSRQRYVDRAALSPPRPEARLRTPGRVTATFAVLIGTALGVAGVLLLPRIAGSFGSPRQAAHTSVPGPNIGRGHSPSPKSKAPNYPSTFVAPAESSLALFDSTTGRLIRFLTTPPLGGGDQYPTLTSDGRTVYFVRTTSSCGVRDSRNGIWSVSTGGGPATEVVVSPSEDADLDPVVSADGRYLAWQRRTCRKGDVAVYVKDLRNGAQRAISGGGDVLAWAPDDRHLLLASGSGGAPGVALLDSVAARSTGDAKRFETKTCGQQFPRFAQNGTFVALTCALVGDTTGVVAVFDEGTGQQVRVIAVGLPVAPTSSFYPPRLVLSFSFSRDGASAIWATFPTPANWTSNVWRWSDGHAVRLPVSTQQVAW